MSHPPQCYGECGASTPAVPSALSRAGAGPLAEASAGHKGGDTSTLTFFNLGPDPAPRKAPQSLISCTLRLMQCGLPAGETCLLSELAKGYFIGGHVDFQGWNSVSHQHFLFPPKHPDPFTPAHAHQGQSRARESHQRLARSGSFKGTITGAQGRRQSHSQYQRSKTLLAVTTTSVFPLLTLCCV